MNPKKVHPIVKPTYILRVIAWFFWSIVIISLSFENLHYSKSIWLFLFVNVILWPHISYLITIRSQNSRNFEVGNQLIDAFIVGIWIPIVQFSVWPTFAIILCIAMSNMSVKGVRLMLSGMFFILMGASLCTFFYGTTFLPITGTITSVLCACLSFIYAILIAGNAYRYAISAAHAKRQIKFKNKQLDNLAVKLSEYLPKQLVDNIADDNEADIASHKREKLTLFFSDIKDFTHLTDALEPEDMACIINEYLTEMNSIIDRYQGTLAQVIGDGLYVFFGAPNKTNDEDHALRCIKMAVDMQLKMDDLNKKWFKIGIDEELKIRCGINTGMVTVGGYGSSERKEFTAMGMQVNLAARLESACDVGQILLNHPTYVLIKDHIPCVEKGEIEIKGYHRPIKVYEVDLNKFQE